MPHKDECRCRETTAESGQTDDRSSNTTNDETHNLNRAGADDLSEPPTTPEQRRRDCSRE
jgi:hypothetical protein